MIPIPIYRTPEEASKIFCSVQNEVRRLCVGTSCMAWVQETKLQKQQYVQKRDIGFNSVEYRDAMLPTGRGCCGLIRVG